MKNIITYSLRETSYSSDSFYNDLTAFTENILFEASKSLERHSNNYYEYVKTSQHETIRSKDEYLLELIMIGIFWNNYIHKASKTRRLPKIFLKQLYSLRRKSETLKPIIDYFRGYLAYELLIKQKDNTVQTYNLDACINLLEWLGATGEFNEEVIRLNKWIDFFKDKNKDEIEDILKLTILFSVYFYETGKQYFGKYTHNVTRFLNDSVKKYIHREDYFFISRTENEYFLNMFGAEIMNRQLKKEFDKSSKKAILLPTCMRKQPKNGCQAKSDGKELVCRQCNIDCNIGKVAKALELQNITPYLIPHSSDFSKFLIKWKDNRETGLIGVACVLNLLTGGYEMKRLNIASQCIFLDYCGCQKHWDKNGIPTDLNICKLKQIVTNTAKSNEVIISKIDR